MLGGLRLQAPGNKRKYANKFYLELMKYSLRQGHAKSMALLEFHDATLG
jgi:hypothetical protein